MAIPFQRVFRSLLSEPPPGLACEFTHSSVAVARWRPGAVQPERIAVRDLPPDALRPQPLRENFAAAAAVAEAVGSALEDAQASNTGKRHREIALLLPDMSARVTVLTFEQLPPKSEEILPLLRFRLKKAVPFDVDEAAIAWRISPARNGSASRDLVVAVTPRAIVRQYEAIFEQLGYLPGEVTVSTVAGLNLVVDVPGAESGSMLLRASSGSLRGDSLRSGSQMTIAVTSQNELRMLRSSDYGDEPVDGAGERFRDIYSSAVFFQDTYAGKIDRVWHSGFDDLAAPLWSAMETELGVAAKPLAVPGASDPRYAPYLGLFGIVAETAKQV